MEHREDILNTVDGILISEPYLSKLPQLPIHCDYHQGNLKYQNSHVIGVFDFDWSKIDLRLFDLALALVYFSACWDGQAAGSLNLDKYKLFLQTYNVTCALTASPGPLSELEKQYLPSLLAAGNLFVLHWTIVDFYTLENPDDAVEAAADVYEYVEKNREDIESASIDMKKLSAAETEKVCFPVINEINKLKNYLNTHSKDDYPLLKQEKLILTLQILLK